MANNKVLNGNDITRVYQLFIHDQKCYATAPSSWNDALSNACFPLLPVNADLQRHGYALLVLESEKRERCHLICPLRVGRP